MSYKKVKNIIFAVKEAYKNNLYFLSEKLLSDIVENDLKYYKLYILFAYLVQKNDDENKLITSIKYSSKTISLNKHYLLAYCLRYKAVKKLLEIYKSKNINNDEDIKKLEELIKQDMHYLKEVSNNFIIKKHIKNFVKNPLSYYDKKKMILKTSADIKRFNREKVRYDYADIMEDFNKSISINSRLAENYYNRAKLKYTLKMYEEALADFRKAQKIFVRNNIDSPLDIIKCDHYIAWCNYSLNRDEKIFLDIEVDEDIADVSEGYYNSGKLKFNKKNYEGALKDFSNVKNDCKNAAKTKYYKKICMQKINNNINIDLIISILRLSDIYKNENDFHVTENLCNEALEYIENIKKDDDFWYFYLKGVALYELYDISFLDYKLKEETLYYLNKSKDLIEKESKYHKKIEKIITDITEYGI